MLDTVLNKFGAALIGAALIGGGMPGGYEIKDGHYVVRCFNDVNFVKYVIKQQGYGKLVEDVR